MKLALFFTKGMSLGEWDRIGMLRREVAIYRRFRRAGHDVAFVTYGASKEKSIDESVDGIEVCCNAFHLPSGLYEHLAGWFHGHSLCDCDVIKTNQINGGIGAMIVAERFGIPLVARCGYMWSEFQERRFGKKSIQVRDSLDIEKHVFSAATKIVVTTEEMRCNLVNRGLGWDEKIRVIPNYVDTDLFSPAEKPPVPNKICYIGQLKQNQKNPLALIEAVRSMDVTLDMIGEGGDRPKLEVVIDGLSHITLHGNVPNQKLPEYLKASSLFVLPSFFEGHPKALIEAMSCGLPVVTTDVPGINNIIIHGENGWLCKPTAESIRAGIQTVLEDILLRRKLGHNARQFAVQHYSLDRIAVQEMALYDEIMMGVRG